MLILNGHLLHSFQSCRRRYLIELQYRYLPHHPNTLLSACMRQSILALSAGHDLHACITRAVNSFISNTKYPGLDLPSGLNTYTLTMDYTACIRTILTYLNRADLPSIRLKPNTHVHGELEWSYLSFEDEAGMLHRWKFTDSISDASIQAELHSWEVFGDLVISRLPMTLHLVNIGRRNESRRTSPWCRAYRSPTINLYRFQRKGGTALGEGWKPIYFADNPDNDPETWVDLMQSDGVTDSLIRHVTVRDPDPTYITDFHRHLQYEHAQMSAIEGASPFDLPLSRGTCDSPYVCPHQPVCYSRDCKAELHKSGNYELRITSPTSPSPSLQPK